MSFKSVGPAKMFIDGQEYRVVEFAPCGLECCNCEVMPMEVEIFIPVATFSCEFQFADAASMIAALPPIRFSRNRACQLGNRCVRALEAKRR